MYLIKKEITLFFPFHPLNHCYHFYHLYISIHKNIYTNTHNFAFIILNKHYRLDQFRIRKIHFCFTFTFSSSNSLHLCRSKFLTLLCSFLKTFFFNISFKSCLLATNFLNFCFSEKSLYFSFNF